MLIVAQCHLKSIVIYPESLKSHKSDRLKTSNHDFVTTKINISEFYFVS